jgi:hypothetical protein
VTADFHAYALALQVSAVAIGLWATTSTLEGLAGLKRYAPGKLLGGDLFRLRSGRIDQHFRGGICGTPAAIATVLALRLVAALSLLVTRDVPIILIELVLIVATSSFFSLRLTAPDGADKMGMVAACGALLLALGVVRLDSELCFAGILWAGGQLTIAYATSGYIKLISRGWRDGSTLIEVMQSEMFGSPWAGAAILRVPAVAIVLGWIVISTETLFPLALLAPQAVLAAVLAFFVFLHLAIAILLRLSTYPWAFVATYPSVVLLGAALRAAF